VSKQMNRKNPNNRTNQQQFTYQTETVWLPRGIAISMTAAQRSRSDGTACRESARRQGDRVSRSGKGIRIRVAGKRVG